MMRNNLTRPLLLLLLILSLGSGCRKQDSAAEMEQSKPAPGSYYKTLELLNEKQKSIYRLAVVAYVYAASLAELQKRVKAFQLEPYRVISDLHGKEGPLDKKMGIKGIPTYFYTDRQGRVRRVVAGFEPDRFTMETGLSPQWGESWTGE